MSSTSHPDTDALLAACHAGDGAARDSLFARHRAKLRRMVAVHWDPRLSGRLDPSDVVQEAFAEATARLPRFLLERPIPFYPWLRQIAWERLLRLHERHVLAQRRSVDREIDGQLHLPDESVSLMASRLVTAAASPSGHVLRDEMIRRVRQALELLTPAERDLIILRYIEELPFEEIAAIQGTSAGTIRSRHFRAIRRIQELLKG